jgi:hypothetical protein
MTAVGLVFAGIGWFSRLAAEWRTDLTAVDYGLILVGLTSCLTLLVLSRTAVLPTSLIARTLTMFTGTVVAVSRGMVDGSVEIEELPLALVDALLDQGTEWSENRQRAGGGTVPQQLSVGDVGHAFPMAPHLNPSGRIRSALCRHQRRVRYP